MNTHQPIAVLDSGVGGISVLRELRRQMPQENYLYFGDSANAPYGEKSAEEVRALTLAHAEALFDAGAKALVVACNTATGVAISALRERFADRPIIGIEPALKPAALQKTSPTILVMATPLTLRQEKFEHLLARYNRQAHILTLPCHGLVELIEQGITDGEVLSQLLRDLFRPLAGESIDSVVLGCTHYPLVRTAIQAVVGDSVTLFDGGAGTARETRHQLERRGLCCTDGTAGTIVWRSSCADPALPALCERLLNSPD